MEGQETFTFDYGSVELEKLILTSDTRLVEKLKAQGNIGVLFEPGAVEGLEIEGMQPIYLVGISKDREQPVSLAGALRK